MRAHYAAVVAPWAGVAAERAGLRIVDEADEAVCAAGCRLVGTPTVRGTQNRTVRQLVQRKAANPFASHPPEPVRLDGVEATLRWAATWCPLDTPRTVSVTHSYRLYRRTVGSRSSG